MDTERLGRVLGFGARHAAKTLVGAIDAATAPAPQASRGPAAEQRAQPRAAMSTPAQAPSAVVIPPTRGDSSPLSSDSASRRSQTARTLPAAESTPRRAAAERPASAPKRGVAEGARRFGRAVWEPAVRLSGVLWLEITGLFFLLFAFIAATAAWRLRTAAHLLPAPPGGAAPNAEAHTQLFIALGMLVVFGYFAVSSFLRASRKGRRR